MLRKLKLHISNMTNNPRLLEHASKRLSTLERRLLKSTEGIRWNIRLSKEGHSKKGDTYHAEAQVQTARKNYGAEASGETPFQAIDELREGLAAKIIGHKEKSLSKQRRGGREVKALLREPHE